MKELQVVGKARGILVTKLAELEPETLEKMQRLVAKVNLPKWLAEVAREAETRALLRRLKRLLLAQCDCPVEVEVKEDCSD